MYDTEYIDGVLVCHIHKTPISKQHGRFFCLKCQRNIRIRDLGHVTEEELQDITTK